MTEGTPLPDALAPVEGSAVPSASLGPTPQAYLEPKAAQQVLMAMQGVKQVHSPTPEGVAFLSIADQLQPAQHDRVLDLHSQKQRELAEARKLEVTRHYEDQADERRTNAEIKKLGMSQELSRYKAGLITVGLGIAATVAVVIALIVTDHTEHVPTIIGTVAGLLGGFGAGRATAGKKLKKA